MENLPAPIEEEIDLSFSGRYAIESSLGMGSSGVVYRAIDRDTGARVALKTLHSVTADQVAILKNEFRVVQGLNHPNLVQILDLTGRNGRWFLSMEYVDGEDFLAYVTDRHGSFIEAKLRAVLRQLALAVAALHEARIVHRDLKPSNVLVTREGRVVVLDFGLATSQDRRHSRDQGIAGTVLYMAPEQALVEDVGPPADWYSVGVMMFRAMTGVCPFEGEAGDVLERKASERASSADFEVRSLPPDLVSLCDDLLRIAPEERPTAKDILARLGAVSAKPRHSSMGPPIGLVGRDEELAWLRRSVGIAGSGDVRCAIVMGESGVGKSVLLQAFSEQLQDEFPDLLVLLSRCYEREFVPFKAFDGAIEALVAVLEQMDAGALAPCLSEHAGLLPRIFPELELISALSTLSANASVEDPLAARRLGFEALRALLCGLAVERPIALLIEDLHWADADSLALLRALLEPPNAPPLLLVCTMRTGTITKEGKRPTSVDLPGVVNVLQLEKLAPSEAARFVISLSKSRGSHLSPEEVGALVRESEGHPMFLAELVAQAHEVHDPAVPRRLEDVLQRRVEMLEADARRFLEVVSVAGVRVDQRVAADAASIDRTDLTRIVPMLHAARLVQTKRDHRTTIIEPYHDRIREAVVSSLDEDAVRAWHAKLALAWELSGGQVEPEVLAQHWLRAGAADRAKAYILRGAAKASAALAFERAASFYEQAIALSSTRAEARPLRLELAEALTNAKRWREAAEIRLSVAADAPMVEALQLRTAAAEQLLCSGRFDEGVTTLLGVTRELGVFVPRAPLVALVAFLLARALLALRGLVARSDDDVLAPSRAAAIDALIAASFGFGMWDNILGNYFNTRALLAVLYTTEPSRLARALFSETIYVASRGAPSRRRTLVLIDRLKGIGTTVERHLVAAYVAGAEGYLHHFALDWPRAKTALLLSARIFNDQCVGQFWATNTMRTLGFRAMAYLGSARELRGLVTSALHETERVGDLYGTLNLKAGPLAWLRLVEDRTEALARELEELAPLVPKGRYVVQSYFYMVARVQFELYRGRGDAAFEAVAADWPALRRSFLLRMSAVRVAAWDLRGRAALSSAMRGNARSRAPRLRLAMALARRMELEPYACAKGQAALLRAGVHALRHRHAEAVREAERAEEAFALVSMKFHVAASQWFRGALVGGDAGAALVAAARFAYSAELVENPEAFAAMLAPVLLAPQESSRSSVTDSSSRRTPA